MRAISWILLLLVGIPWHEVWGEGPKRPNVVIIYADDLGYGDVSCYNAARGKIATPHIDRLAVEGMRFTDAHSSSAVCSPSRYTLLTGRYHWRSRLQKGIVGLWGKPLIPAKRLTLGSLAQSVGYRTACIGKWHLGWEWPISEAQMEYFRTGGYGGKKDLEASDAHRGAWRNVFSQALKGGPTAVGFDEYFGVDVPNWPPYCFIENDRTIGIPREFADVKLFARNQASVQGPALPGWTLEPILPALARRTVAFIDREAQTETPFLVYLSLTSPHTPLSVNRPWLGQSGLNLYADLVLETDAVVGQVLEALDRNEINEETMVVFTSDNGCAPYIGVEELEAKGHFPSGPLRGYKSDVWEGGHRVPFLIRWPNHVRAGVVESALVHQADMIATLADVFDVTLPPNAGEDSFSLVPLLNGTALGIRKHSVSCAIGGLPSIRLDSWKYIPAGGSGGWTKGGESETAQLYELDKDLAESRNLVESHSDQVKVMTEAFESLIANGRSNTGPRQDNDVAVKRY